MNNVLNLIDLYIAAKKMAWAPTTLKSEKARLAAVAGVLAAHENDPVALWDHLVKHYEPYSRVTIFTRVISFINWYLEYSGSYGSNAYKTFRERNARLFKHAYKTSTPSLSFEEASARIKTITNDQDRNLAMQILGSGERFCEAIQPTNEVIGKGNKPRHVFRSMPNKEGYKRSYASFRNSLAAVGLKPHDLRKLCATRLVEAGLKEADLMQVMGWNSILTAKCYLQPKKQDELNNIFSKLHKEIL